MSVMCALKALFCLSAFLISLWLRVAHEEVCFVNTFNVRPRRYVAIGTAGGFYRIICTISLFPSLGFTSIVFVAVIPTASAQWMSRTSQGCGFILTKQMIKSSLGFCPSFVRN